MRNDKVRSEKKTRAIEWVLWSDRSLSQSKKLRKLDEEAEEEKRDRLGFTSFNQKKNDAENERRRMKMEKKE